MSDKEQLDRIEAKLDSLLLLIAARGPVQPLRSAAPQQPPPREYAPQVPEAVSHGQQYAPAAPQYAPAAPQYAPAPAAQQYAPAPAAPQYAPPPYAPPQGAPRPPPTQPYQAQHATTPQPYVPPAQPRSSAPAQAYPPPSDGPVASDDDLDSKHGNPEVRKDPGRWRGESMAGRRFSDCPPEYLDVLASLFDWRAEQDEKKGDARSKWARLDAARARGWARRLRGGGASGAGGFGDGGGEGLGPPRDPAFTQGPGFAPPAAPPNSASRSLAIAAGENPDAEPAEPALDATIDDVPF
jgi:hypothetical protein